VPLSSGRRGTSVAELLVALSVFGLLSLAVVGVLRRMQDAYRIHTQQADRRQTLRAAAAILPTELRELDAAEGDLVAMGATAITIRAPRQLGLLCRAQPPGPPGPMTLILQGALRYGVREFDADTDSLWVLSEGPTTALEDDRWLTGAVASVGSAPCPDGTAGRRITTTLVAPGVDGFAIGTPVLGFETVTYRLYRSSEDGRWYIGQQTATDFQPVIGPVTAGGLSLAYFDSSGAATPEPTRVRLIEVRVRAATNEPIRDASGRLGKPVDSVVTLVALRNNRAP
jgi:type II secretory pathway pseudopilin PulG